MLPGRDHADVLIIGAGAAGGVAGRRLAEAGLAVVCLEQGQWPERESFPGATPEWELVAAKQWSSSPSVRDAPEDYPLELTDSDVRVLNFNGVGGGTVLYNAQWVRMLPPDFAVRSTDGVADDWPFGYAELQPYYERTDREFGVSGLGGNPMFPPGDDPPLPPLPIGQAGLRVARAHARLGWHWWPQSNAILSTPYDGRRPCVQRGTCGSGCNEGAKASTDLTHWPRVVAAGGRVITGARVVRIVSDGAGLAAGAEWMGSDGRVHLQTAEVVLCAANAVGSARLLLASADGDWPDGLANSSGLVGRRLMLHPLATVTGLFDESLEGWRAHNGGLIQCLEFASSDPDRGFARGAVWELGTAGGPMGAALGRSGAVWGSAHHRHVRERLGRSAMWAIVGEDLPDDSNRVELSTTLADDSGLPAPRISYRASANTLRLIDWQIARASESLTAAGAWRVESARFVPNGHFMGTARMGDDPACSVVDRWCMAHDVPNLGIIDGSVFVTAGASNPTSTIAALALRAADHLIARRADVRTPRHPVAITGFASAGAARPRRDPPRVVDTPDVITASMRRRLEELGDVLIPAADGMPAASDVVIGGPLLDRVLRARPDLVGALQLALGAAMTEPDLLPDELARQDRELHRTLCYVVAAAYYLDEGVRARLGYPGTAAHPVQVRDFPDYIAEGLLDHLLR